MCAFIVILIIALIFIVPSILVKWDVRENERIKQIDFERRMKGHIDHVKRYTSKFNASLEHIKKIRDVFKELVASDAANNMKPYEVFVIPKDHMHFPKVFQGNRSDARV